MPSDDQLQAALERMTAALRERLERDLASFADEVKRAATAEIVAADMRRQAEIQAHIARVHEEARKRIEEIERAAADERDRAVQLASETAVAEARRQAEAQTAQLREAAQKHAEEIRRVAEAQVGELRTTLQAQLEEVRRTAHAQTEEARRTARSEIEEARRIAAAQVDDVQRRADEQIGEIRQSLESQIEDARRWAKAEVDTARAAIETARAEAEAAARAARAEADAAAHAARAEADAAARAARAEAEEVVIAQLASAQADAETKIQQAIDQARTDVLQSELAHTARLVDAIRRLDDARSLGEALDTLADCAGKQVDRAALLVVRGDKLRVHRLAGFAAARPDADLDIQAAGLAGAVVSTGVAVSRSAVEPGDEQSSRQPALPVFAQDAGARHAVALPLVVGGHVVAVLYGDAPRANAPSAASRWPATLEVLARHAGRSLEAMTVQRASGMEAPRVIPRPSRSGVPGPVEHAGTGDEEAARRYARLLVSEIRMYHEPLVDAGRRSRDLRARLGGEIERARRMYEERVPQTVRDRSDYFEQELVRTLADGDRSLLG